MRIKITFVGYMNLVMQFACLYLIFMSNDARFVVTGIILFLMLEFFTDKTTQIKFLDE